MSGYIERQAGEETKNIRWGRFSTIGRGGCGAVAAYNVAVALGRNPDFLRLVQEMERRRMPSIGGLCGMNVIRLKLWLQRRFGRAELSLFGAERWEEKTRFCHAVVIFYKNKGIFKGNHFIAGAREADGFVFHNAPNLPVGCAVTMEDAVHRLKKAGHTPIFLLVL